MAPSSSALYFGDCLGPDDDSEWAGESGRSIWGEGDRESLESGMPFTVLVPLSSILETRKGLMVR